MGRRILGRSNGMRFGSFTIALFVANAAPLLAGDEAKPPPTSATSAEDLFGLTKLWTVHLEIPANEYEAMQPALPAPPGGPSAPPQPRPEKNPRESESNLFGTRFPWVEAEFTAE